MPKVTIEKQSKHSAKDTFDKVRNMLETDSDLRKFDPKFNCIFNEPELSGTAKGSQFQAAMKIKDDGEGCKVELEIEIPLMLAPFKGMVQSTLDKKLTSTLS